MRAVSLVVLVLAAPVLVAQDGDQRASYSKWIAKLGASNYREREQASSWLRKHPDCEDALRSAVSRSDPETRARIRSLLQHFQRVGFEAAVKDGRIEKVIDIASAWPEGGEHEVFKAFQSISRTLYSLVDKQICIDKSSVSREWLEYERCPRVVRAARVSEAPPLLDRPDDPLLLLTGELDLRNSRRTYDNHAFVISTGPVRIPFGMSGRCRAVFTNADVEFCSMGGSGVIVSGGNVNIKSFVSRMVIIARGNITCSSIYPGISNSVLISGKSVIFQKPAPKEGRCVISENDPNPLGYIRWSDAPKKKAEEKAK